MRFSVSTLRTEPVLHRSPRAPTRRSSVRPRYVPGISSNVVGPEVRVRVPSLSQRPVFVAKFPVPTSTQELRPLPRTFQRTDLPVSRLISRVSPTNKEGIQTKKNFVVVNVHNIVLCRVVPHTLLLRTGSGVEGKERCRAPQRKVATGYVDNKICKAQLR